MGITIIVPNGVREVMMRIDCCEDLRYTEAKFANEPVREIKLVNSRNHTLLHTTNLQPDITK